LRDCELNRQPRFSKGRPGNAGYGCGGRAGGRTVWFYAETAPRLAVSKPVGRGGGGRNWQKHHVVPRGKSSQKMTPGCFKKKLKSLSEMARPVLLETPLLQSTPRKGARLVIKPM
jgi:hypothetical protein